MGELSRFQANSNRALKINTESQSVTNLTVTAMIVIRTSIYMVKANIFVEMNCVIG